MPPIRHHGEPVPESTGDAFDDEDDMPPLVEQPPTLMTYTFFAEMTPQSFSSFSPSSPSFSQPHTQADLALVPYELKDQAHPFQHAEETLDFEYPKRSSHGKRRDESYIPRPPNAFILFRSSFIRDQQVPGKVEGSHSNLSKIAGMVWKSLPQTERDEWEVKAQHALLEHRRRYPDWRFRPGANAAASAKGSRGKLKLKDARKREGVKDPPDKGKGEGSSRGVERRRRQSTKGKTRQEEEEEEDREVGDHEEEEDHDAEGDDDSEYEDAPAKGKGKAKARAKARARPRAAQTTTGTRTGKRNHGRRLDFSLHEHEHSPPSVVVPKSKEAEHARLAKIAEMLREGTKGLELEAAMDRWAAAGSGAQARSQPENIARLDDRLVDGGTEKGRPRPPPPLIITPAPAAYTDSTIPPTPTPPSAPSPTTSYSHLLPSPTSIPAAFLSSPTLAPSPLATPPLSPALSPPRGVKRSLSAPAPDERHRLERGALARVPVSSGSLPLPQFWSVGSVDGEGREHGKKKTRHRSSASVSGPMAWTGSGSLHHTHPSTSGYAGPVDTRYMEGRGEEYVVSPVSAATPAESLSLNYYFPPPPTSAPSSWHQPDGASYGSWWPSQPQAPNVEMYEPMREGSFESYDVQYPDAEGYPSVSTSAANPAAVVTTAGEALGVSEAPYRKMTKRYLEQFPYAPAEEGEARSMPPQSQEPYSHPQESQQQQAYASTSTPDSSPIHTREIRIRVQAQAQDTSAGGVFHPLPPSSFSSLTGWDGSRRVMGASESDLPRGGGGAADDCVVAPGGVGGSMQGASGAGETRGVVLWDGYGWGSLQSVGIGVGGDGDSSGGWNGVDGGGGGEVAR
ncbi:hypothetical protein H0H87_009124 [Tephrocybe sp. NHM501043]|nr:hypothetical protein H0H87_009124 [Tephrocybe sp. NHM501043]